MNLFHRSPIASPNVFDQLYQQNRQSVFRYLYGLTGGPQEDVEDLTAETFLRAWKARHRFDGDENHATGWLIRIAKHLVIDEYRRRMTQARNLPPDHAGENLPEQNALENDERQFLLQQLAELPDTQREILVLRYMLGWRVGEIARHLGMTENNVSVTIHRTLARLREMWQETESADLPELFAIKEKI